MTTKQYTEAMDKLDAMDRRPEYRDERKKFAQGSQYLLVFEPIDDSINAMTHAERRAFVQLLDTAGEKRIMRNLTYDYETQEWI